MPRLTRRGLLIGGAVAATAPAWTAPARAGTATDEFDTLRGRWRDLLTGTGFDPTAAPYAAALAALGTTARTWSASMTPAGTWSDLPLGKVSNNMTQGCNRLKAMALAYVQPETGLTGDATIEAQIHSGLAFLATNGYTAGRATFDNWWDWQIGSPQSLVDLSVLMFPRLTADEIGAVAAAVDWFVPDSAVAVYSGTSTGANRADLCKVMAIRGILGRDAAKVATAAAALSPIFPYVTTGDGLYSDGSFIQHTWVPYTNSYGEVMLQDLSRLFTLLAGSTWDITDPRAATVVDSVTRAFAPFVHNGLAMDGVSGRAISRGLTGTGTYPQSDHTRGHAILSDVLRLAGSSVGTQAQRDAWKAMVKGWLRRERFQPYLRDPGVQIPELARAQALLDDPSIQAAAEPVGHRVFGMDRAVHRRPQWTAAVSMCSARTTYYENGNGENLHGWHTGMGMVYWWGAGDDDQFSDGYWPTVDPYRLPGTTVSSRRLADAAGGAWGAPKPAATFAGGATDGMYAVLGQDIRGLQSTLVGKKAWFCLDDTIVCLGAGITATDGVPIETVVENRRVDAGRHRLSVDGRPVAAGPVEFPRARIATIAGVGAYVFPGGAAITALSSTRTGAWHDINGGGSTAELSRDYVTLYVDHGSAPVDAGYEYLLMPGAGAGQAARRPRPDVLANTGAAQAINDRRTGVTAANFHAAGGAGPLAADGPASVLVREHGGRLTIAVADPAQSGRPLTVTYRGPAARVLAADPGVTATVGRGTVTLAVDTTAAYGRSFTAVVAAR